MMKTLVQALDQLRVGTPGVSRTWASEALRAACERRPFPTRGELATRLIHRARALAGCVQTLQREDGIFLANRELATIREFWTETRLNDLNKDTRMQIQMALAKPDAQVLSQCALVDDRPSVLRREVYEMFAREEQLRPAVQEWHWLWKVKPRIDELKARAVRAQAAQRCLSELLTHLHAHDAAAIEKRLKDYSEYTSALWLDILLKQMFDGVRLAFNWLGGEYAFYSNNGDDLFSRMFGHGHDRSEFRVSGAVERIVTDVAREDLRSCSERFTWLCNADSFYRIVTALGGEDEFDREAVLRHFVDLYGLDLMAPAALVRRCQLGTNDGWVPAHAFCYLASDDRVIILVLPNDPFQRAREPGTWLYQFRGDLSQAVAQAYKEWTPVERDGKRPLFYPVAVRDFCDRGSDIDKRAFRHLLGDEGLERVTRHLELRREFLSRRWP